MTKLQYFRKKKNISQFELAKRVSVSIQAIQKYEQMVLPIEGVRVSVLLKMANVLDCKIWQLIDDENIAKELRTQYYNDDGSGAEH